MLLYRPAVLLLLTLISCTLPVTGLAGVYSWKDASGKTHYGDRPPAENQAESRKLAAPPAADESAQKNVAERQLADREKQQKAQEDTKKTQEEQSEAKKRQEGCQQAKSNLSAIESGQVRFTIDAQGERVALDGAVRNAELARARKSVNEWCSPPKPAAK